MGSDILRNATNDEAAAIFAVWPISGTFVDPCTDHTLVQPTPGPGIDELADALANQPGTEAGPPTAVTVDGYPAKRVDVDRDSGHRAVWKRQRHGWLLAVRHAGRRSSVSFRAPTS